MFYVYEWYIENNNEIFYVGKGSKNRYKVRKHNKFFNDFIKRFKCNSRIIKTFENEEDAFRYEFERITELKTIGQCVCNIHDGGLGGTVDSWTEEKRERYSKYNVMKSKKQRKRMSINNPMKNKEVAINVGKKHRKAVFVNGIFFDSIKAGANYIGTSDIYLTHCLRHRNGICFNLKCEYANQQPSQENINNSILKGSTTNG